MRELVGTIGVTVNGEARSKITNGAEVRRRLEGMCVGKQAERIEEVVAIQYIQPSITLTVEVHC